MIPLKSGAYWVFHTKYRCWFVAAWDEGPFWYTLYPYWELPPEEIANIGEQIDYVTSMSQRYERRSA